MVRPDRVTAAGNTDSKPSKSKSAEKGNEKLAKMTGNLASPYGVKSGVTALKGDAGHGERAGVLWLMRDEASRSPIGLTNG